MSTTIEDSLMILERAKNLINAHGWTQGTYGSEDEGFCLMGAVSRANDDVIPWGAIDHLVSALGSEQIIGWNDTFGRTKEEVLDLFDRTIARLENAA